MHLKVIRGTAIGDSTVGKLYVDNVFECYTLEDLVRDKKIAGVTAIPAGTYDIVIDMSNHFKRLLPLVKNVPNYLGVRIHPGNTAADTEGCILVGTVIQTKQGNPFLANSRVAFDALFSKMQKATKITLEIA